MNTINIKLSITYNRKNIINKNYNSAVLINSNNHPIKIVRFNYPLIY